MADALLELSGYYLRTDAVGRRMMESLVLALLSALAVRAALHILPACALLARPARTLKRRTRTFFAGRAASWGFMRSRLRVKAKARPTEDSRPKAGLPPAGDGGRETARAVVRPGGAVAEYDFLRNASREDVRALRRMFGYVWVEKAAYDESVSTPDGKDKGLTSLLVPVKVEAGKDVYPSITIAERMNSVVLTDSANIRRICAGRGVRCVGRGELGGAS